MTATMTLCPLEVAVAEVVDNSLAASANHVHIRLVVREDALRTLYVVDDGSGLTPTQMDTLAFESENLAKAGPRSLGFGLRAASFSQADSLTVFSVAAQYVATGRRWLASKPEAREGDIVGSGLAAQELARRWPFRQPTGTTVRWDGVRALAAPGGAGFAPRLSETVSRMQRYLAVVFHRALERGVGISIDVEEDGAGVGPAADVRALNPFGYPRTGAQGYPKTFAFQLDGATLRAQCHIWPGRSEQPEFLLPHNSPEHYQGIYFYRRDRLLQIGGWDELRLDSRDLQLARIAIDLDGERGENSLVRDAENNRVLGGPEFAAALRHSRAADDTTFEAYLGAARKIFAKSHSRNRARPQVIPLGRGLPAPVKRTVERELDSLSGHLGVDLRWRNFTDDVFFDIDRESNAIWLNSRYRNYLGGYARYTFNDAPLVKTLLFLLVENLFHSSHWGAQERDKLELWQRLLTSAAKEQMAGGATSEKSG